MKEKKVLIPNSLKTIPGFKNYAVSRSGMLFNIKRNRKIKRFYTPLGYPYVGLFKEKKNHNKQVQRLVALIFLKNKDKRKNRVGFKDGDKTNCDVSNLKWQTHQEACKNGNTGNHQSYLTGDKNGNAKLTQRKVNHIRKAYAKGEASQYQLSLMYGVTDACISKVVNNKTW